MRTPTHQTSPNPADGFGMASQDAAIEKFFTALSQGRPEQADETPPSQGLEGWLGMPLDLSRTTDAGRGEIDFAISPIFPAGRASLITGLGASSKSTLLKTLAVATATGRDVLGMRVPKPGKAVLLLAEDTAEDAFGSLAAITDAMELNAAEQALMQQRLVIFPAAGQSCMLVEPETEGHPAGRLGQLIDFAKRLGNVRLIGLDPAIALTRGRELDELAQRDLATTAERLAIATGAAVIVISHAAKSSQFQQEVTSHMSRGSGAITDAFRLEVGMRVMTSKEAATFQVPHEDRHRFVKMQVTKANNLPPDLMKPLWLQRVQGGALALANLKPPAPTNQTRRLHALEPFLDTHSDTGEIFVKPLSKSDWKAQVLELGLLTGSTTSARDMSASRLVAALKEIGWLHESGGKLELTEKGLAQTKGRLN